MPFVPLIRMVCVVNRHCERNGPMPSPLHLFRARNPERMLRWPSPSLAIPNRTSAVSSARSRCPFATGHELRLVSRAFGVVCGSRQPPAPHRMYCVDAWPSPIGLPHHEPVGFPSHWGAAVAPSEVIGTGVWCAYAPASPALAHSPDYHASRLYRFGAGFSRHNRVGTFWNSTADAFGALPARPRGRGANLQKTG